MTNIGELLYGPRKNKRQPVSRSQRTAIRLKQRGHCKRCGKVLVVEEYHHITPVAHGGRSTTRNLSALCPECHRIIHAEERARKSDTRRRKPKNKIDMFG